MSPSERPALSRILREVNQSPPRWRAEGLAMASSHSRMFVTPGLERQVLLEQRAHFMRFHPTPSEALLWSRLRGHRLGVLFRRQVVIGAHIVDFCAPAVRLVVEVDGDAYHAERETADGRRDGKLVAAGYRVLRLPASLVERRLEEAVRLVREALRFRLGSRP